VGAGLVSPPASPYLGRVLLSFRSRKFSHEIATPDSLVDSKGVARSKAYKSVLEDRRGLLDLHLLVRS